MIKKIIFGGQTGVDIGGIDAGIECVVEYGGWLLMAEWQRTAKFQTNMMPW